MASLVLPPKAIIGMIHLPALPGTPRNTLSPTQIIDQAVQEAIIYQEAGIDALALENMHDLPYLKGTVGPEIISTACLAAAAVKRETGLPCGLQLLAGANIEALAAAHAANLDFIRAEGFVFAHVADEGIIEASAGELLRYRKQIGAEGVAVFCDIKKKHSAHAITADVDLVETAKAAVFFLSDGIIVTGSATGEPAALDEVRRVKEVVEVPVLVGSGVTLDNVLAYLEIADGLIVGSYFKEEGHWASAPDGNRIKRLMEKVRKNY